MSLVPDDLGRVELLIFAWFFNFACLLKTTTNTQISTRPNHWATNDKYLHPKTYLLSTTCEWFLAILTPKSIQIKKIRKYPHFLTMQTLQEVFNPAWAVFKLSAFELPAAFFNFAAFSAAFCWAWIFCCPRAIIWKMTEILNLTTFEILPEILTHWTIWDERFQVEIWLKKLATSIKRLFFSFFEIFCSDSLLYLLEF